MLCPHSLSWEEQLVPIGWPLVSALLSPYWAPPKTGAMTFHCPLGTHWLWATVIPRASTWSWEEWSSQGLPCVYYVSIRIQGNVSEMEGLKGSWQPYPHVGPYVGPLRALRMLTWTGHKGVVFSWRKLTWEHILCVLLREIAQEQVENKRRDWLYLR